MVMVLPIPSMIVPIAENLGETPLGAPIRMVTDGPIRPENLVGMETVIQPIGCKRLIQMEMGDMTITAQIAAVRTRSRMNSH